MTRARRRVVAIGLDMLAVPFTEQLMDRGSLPALAGLRETGTRFLLDHGTAQATGLAWEHVATGRSPGHGGRPSAVEFDPGTYQVRQLGTDLDPAFERVDRRTVVFDVPYLDLRRADRVAGVVGWGAHDPGVEPAAQPPELLEEFAARVGPYPASPWLYATPWPTASRCEAMADALANALDRRTDAARWLMTERLTDWDLFFAVSGEVHSAIEGLWHGVDPDHPLHHHPSACAAGRGLGKVLSALDRFVAVLTDAAQAVGADVVAFSMGGMGPNRSDVPSMVLLPELLHRHAFGRPLLRLPNAWSKRPSSMPDPLRGRGRALAGGSWIPPETRTGRLRAAAVRQIPPGWRRGLRRSAGSEVDHEGPAEMSLRWQPASRYQPTWAQMRAFALPSFYDGRVRINLMHRERRGVVSLGQYEAVLDEIESVVRACRDPRTGEPVVATVDRPGLADPLGLSPSNADIVLTWRGFAAAFDHPDLGLIGPVPFRRTGGHTGRHGVAYVVSSSLRPGDGGVRSSFDVVPTIIDLLGCDPPDDVCGTSLLTP